LFNIYIYIYTRATKGSSKLFVAVAGAGAVTALVRSMAIRTCKILKIGRPGLFGEMMGHDLTKLQKKKDVK